MEQLIDDDVTPKILIEAQKIGIEVRVAISGLQWNTRPTCSAAVEHLAIHRLHTSLLSRESTMVNLVMSPRIPAEGSNRFGLSYSQIWCLAS